MRPHLYTCVAFACLAAACGSNAPAPAASTAAPVVTVSEVSGTVPRNAIVSLLSSESTQMPDGPAVMDQYAKTFVPNVLYVRVGQPVEFKNSEDMPHNVKVSRRGTGAEVFNVGTEPQQKHVHTFDRAGQFDVLCDIHPGMQATVIAAASSIVTIADDAGRFTIPNVKPGTYTVNVVFEGRTLEQPLEVAGARTTVTVTP